MPYWMKSYGGFLELESPFRGLLMRIVVFWGLYWGTLLLEKYQMVIMLGKQRSKSLLQFYCTSFTNGGPAQM